MPRSRIVLAILAVLVAVSFGAPIGRALGPSVSVLVDFGDGTYLWGDVSLPADNVTALKATELAVSSWGIPPMKVHWYSFGAFVEDIGDRHPVDPEWWHFYLWNVTAKSWDSSSTGASATNLSEGSTIGWYLAVDDPVTYDSPRPIPTPTSRDVQPSFRGDLRNSGSAHGTISANVQIRWDVDIGVHEIDTAPVAAYGNVYVATRNALVAIDAGTGREVWRNTQVHSLLSTPALYDGHLILGGTDGKLHAVDAHTGTESWSLPLESGAQSTGIASSPAIVDGRAYLGTFNETVTPAPTFTLTDLDGNVLNRTTLKGHVVVLEFSGTWCTPCRLVDGALVDLWPTYSSQDVEFISVYLPPANDPATLAAYRTSNGITWHVAPESDSVAAKYGVSSVPRVFLLDARGVATDDWSPQPGFTRASAAADLQARIDRALEGTGSRITAVNLNNGTSAWTYESASVLMSQPAIANGSLYVGIMGMYDGGVGYDPPYGLLSLDLQGARRWFYRTEGSVAGSPVVAGGLVVFTAKDGYAYAVDRDGTLAWRQSVGVSTSGPAFVAGKLFVASGVLGTSGKVFAFDLAGTKLWEADPGGPVQTSLVADRGLVCGSTNSASGSVFCLRTSDGALAWRYTPSPPEYILGSPVVVGDTLYAPSDNGHLVALRGLAAEPGIPLAIVAVIGAFLAVMIATPIALVLWARRRRKRNA